MRRTFSLRRFTLWLACCAVLLNALAPAVSHAITASQFDVRNPQICSASHVDHRNAPSSEHAGMLDDCGYCLVHAGTFALAPPPDAIVGFPGGHELRAVLFYGVPRPLLALTAAAPRGPPALA